MITLEEDSPLARVGRRLGEWNVRAYIGSTETVDHYRAAHVDDGSRAELYVLRLAREECAAFDVSMQRTAALSGPGLIKPVGGGETGEVNERFAVVPSAGDPTLADQLPDSGMHSRDVALAGLEILDALERLHAGGLFLGGLPLASVSVQSVTPMRLGVPTAAWMTDGRLFPADPDALAPEGPIDAASDQFALGSLLRRLLAGRGRTIPAGTPEAMLDLIGRLTRPEPSERFASYSTVRDRLEILAGKAVPPSRRSGFPLWLIAAVGSFAVVGVAVLAVVFVGRNSGVPSAEVQLPRLPDPEERVAGGDAPVEPAPPPAEPDAPAVEPSAPTLGEDAPPVDPSDAVVSDEPVEVPASPAPDVPEPEGAELEADEAPGTDAELSDPVPEESDDTEEEPAEPTEAVAETVPVEPPPEPEPEPEPEPFDPAPFAGTWTGERAGRPVTWQLDLRSDGTVGGSSTVRVGARESTVGLSGTWSMRADGVEIAIEETGPRPARYTGALGSARGSGRVSSGGRDRGEWTVSR